MLIVMSKACPEMTLKNCEHIETLNAIDPNKKYNLIIMMPPEQEWSELYSSHMFEDARSRLDDPFGVLIALHTKEFTYTLGLKNVCVSDINMHQNQEFTWKGIKNKHQDMRDMFFSFHRIEINKLEDEYSATILSGKMTF
jgi:hypothetical protein